MATPRHADGAASAAAVERAGRHRAGASREGGRERRGRRSARTGRHRRRCSIDSTIGVHRRADGDESAFEGQPGTTRRMRSRTASSMATGRGDAGAGGARCDREIGLERLERAAVRDGSTIGRGYVRGREPQTCANSRGKLRRNMLRQWRRFVLTGAVAMTYTAADFGDPATSGCTAWPHVRSCERGAVSHRQADAPSTGRRVRRIGAVPRPTASCLRRHRHCALGVSRGHELCDRSVVVPLDSVP